MAAFLADNDEAAATCVLVLRELKSADRYGPLVVHRQGAELNAIADNGFPPEYRRLKKIRLLFRGTS